MEFIKLMRPHQWVKNTFLFIPLFFAGEITDTSKISNLILGFIAFSFVASSIYIVNDLIDIEADKKHPKKSKRPLPSGNISKPQALLLFAFCVSIGFAIAFILKDKFLIILSMYFVMNIIYSFILKNIEILDVIIISIGFVLRVKGGGTLCDIYVSEWLTLMIFLLALIMAFAKRRDDVILAVESGIQTRKVTKGYNLEFLNATLAILAAITIVSYLLYTMSNAVIEKWGTHRVYYTCLFVICGILRYLQITIVEKNSGSPTGIFYKDRFIQFSIILWIMSFYFIIYYPEIKIFGK